MNKEYLQGRISLELSWNMKGEIKNQAYKYID
jgi:hypothetical protein